MHAGRLSRVSAVLVLALLLCLLAPGPAWADMGPKPSVVVSIEGLGDGPCFATLLSRERSTGPASALAEDGSNARCPEGQEAVWRAFVDYQDVDGYHFLQEMWDVSSGGELAWRYYPPSDFKLLLYFPETGEFVSAGPDRAYAFHSYFSARLRRDGAGTALGLRRVHRLDDATTAVLNRLAFTLVVEVTLALLFGYRSRRQLLLVLGVNVATQLLLAADDLFLPLRGIFDLGYSDAILVAEAVILALEATAYFLLLERLGKVGMRPRSRPRPLAYALVANVSSFALGLLLSFVGDFPLPLL